MCVYYIYSIVFCKHRMYIVCEYFSFVCNCKWWSFLKGLTALLSFLFCQVQGSPFIRKHTIAKFSCVPPEDALFDLPPPPEPAPPPPPYGRGPASYRNRRYHRNSSRSRPQTLPTLVAHASKTSLCDQEIRMERLQRDVELLRGGWTGHRTQSLFSLPTDDSRSTSASPTSFRPRCLSSMGSPIFRVNVDTLIGAEETDVDTGQTISGSSVDLSVVSGYSRPQSRSQVQASPPRPKSAPPTDGGSDFSELANSNVSFSLRQIPVLHRTQSTSAKSTPCVVHKPQPKNINLLQKEAQQGNGIANVNYCIQDGTVEDEQEFYIWHTAGRMIDCISKGVALSGTFIFLSRLIIV